MVVVMTPLVTEWEPIANVAEIHRLGVSVSKISERLFEIALNLSKEGDVMRYQKFLRPPEHHMHPLRLGVLGLRQKL